MFKFKLQSATSLEFQKIFSESLVYAGFCSGGPATLTTESGTCWVMGNLHNTFDNQYYTFMGNCTYTMAKNCQRANIPTFEVDTQNMNVGNLQVPSVGTVSVNVHGIHIEIVRNAIGIVRVSHSVSSGELFHVSFTCIVWILNILIFTNSLMASNVYRFIFIYISGVFNEKKAKMFNIKALNVCIKLSIY